MTSPTDHLHTIRTIAGNLNPADIRHRAHEWTRGGYPTTSMPEHGTQTDPPILTFDRDDRTIHHMLTDYQLHLTKAAVHLEHARRIEGWFRNTAKPPEEPGQFMCSNSACTDPLEQGRRTGECDKCRRHRSRHALAWPKIRETAA